MFGSLLKGAAKLASKDGGKKVLNVLESDPGSPLTADTLELAATVGKAIIHIGKELLF